MYCKGKMAWLFTQTFQLLHVHQFTSMILVMHIYIHAVLIRQEPAIHNMFDTSTSAANPAVNHQHPPAYQPPALQAPPHAIPGWGWADDPRRLSTKESPESLGAPAKSKCSPAAVTTWRCKLLSHRVVEPTAATQPGFWLRFQVDPIDLNIISWSNCTQPDFSLNHCIWFGYNHWSPLPVERVWYWRRLSAVLLHGWLNHMDACTYFVIYSYI